MSHFNEKKRLVLLISILSLLCLAIAGCISPTPDARVTSTPQGMPSSIPVASVSAAAAAVGSTPSAAGDLVVHFIDVGQGDSILVRYGNKSMLIDGGPAAAGPAVSSYLHSQGVETIDVLVSSHPHEDHIGGLLTVLNDFPVKVVYDSGQPHTTQTYEKYLNLIDQKNIRFKVPQQGDVIDFAPGVTVLVLSPPQGGIGDGDLNDNSIVLKITYGDTSFLMMGDAGKAAEEAMYFWGKTLRSNVLKVGHHGSKYSSGSGFLKAVDPQVSVIEVGAGNPYGHPAPETLEWLHLLGSRVYRTDLDGNVVVTSDGEGISVTAQHSAPA